MLRNERVSSHCAIASRMTALCVALYETVQDEAGEILGVLCVKQPYGMRIAPPAAKIDSLRLHGIRNQLHSGHVRRKFRKTPRHVVVRRHEYQAAKAMRAHPPGSLRGILPGIFSGKIQVSAAIEFCAAMRNLPNFRFRNGGMHTRDEESFGEPVFEEIHCGIQPRIPSCQSDDRVCLGDGCWPM